MYREVIRGSGHEHVRATHESTLEITTDDWLTPAGDCIVGINANRAPTSFSTSFIETAQSTSAKITLTLTVGDRKTKLVGRGDPELSFSSDRCMVARTSSYIDERTIMIESDRAASDLDRDMVHALRAGEPLVASLDVTN